MAIACFCDHCGAENAPGETICCACQQPLTSHADVSGTLLNQRYELLTEVGAGGFGAVYKARDTRENDRLVAVKQINLQGLSSQEIIEATDAFNREAEILSTLSHPLLPTIFDRFSDPDHWYLVMTYIDGSTLDDYLQHHQASGLHTTAGLPLGETLEIALRLCDALHYLHSQQPPVIFRDLKPGNIMRTRKGQLYLIDFGIARRFKPGQAKDTIPFGSPGFAAPEQYGRAQTTPQADIYSLGALLYCLITGDDPSEHPFSFPSLHHTAIAGTRELNTLIQRMISSDPISRPANVQVVQAEFRRIQEINTKANQQGRIWTPPQSQTPPPAGSKQQSVFLNSSMQQRQQLARKTTRRAVITGGLVIGGVAAIGGVVALTNLAQPQQPTVSTYYDPNQIDPNQVATSTPDQSTDATPTPTSTSTIPQNGPTFWSPDLSYAAVLDWSSNQNQYQIEIYQVQGQKRTKTIQVDNNWNYPENTMANMNVPAIWWSPDNSKILALSNVGMIYVWNAVTGQRLFTSDMVMTGDSQAFPPVASWSPDSNYCAFSYSDGKNNVICTVLQAQSGEPAFQTSLANVDRNAICKAAWSPDSRYLAFPDSAYLVIGTPWSASIWDRETSQKISSFGGILSTDEGNSDNTRYNVSSIAWSSDGEKLAAFTDDGSLWINQRGSNQAINVIPQGIHYFAGLTDGLVWSPDGRYLAAIVSGEPTVWNTTNWTTTTQPGGGDTSLQAASVAFAWAANSKSIIIADQNNNISTWSLG